MLATSPTLHAVICACGESFTPWRKKRFCSERCRKIAENRRLGYVRGDEPTSGYIGSQRHKNAEKTTDKSIVSTGIRGDGSPIPGYVWIAHNPITRALVREQGKGAAVGWAMYVAGQGWLGKVRDERGDFSFGPATLPQVRKAVEAWAKHEPIP